MGISADTLSNRQIIGFMPIICNIGSAEFRYRLIFQTLISFALYYHVGMTVSALLPSPPLPFLPSLPAFRPPGQNFRSVGFSSLSTPDTRYPLLSVLPPPLSFTLEIFFVWPEIENCRSFIKSHVCSLQG